MWFIFALTFALTNTFSVIIAKRVMKEASEYLYLWLVGFFTIPFLLLIVIFFFQIPQVDKTFILAVLASIILDVFAAIFAYRAIKISEISLVAPISAFNPVFTSFIALIFLREVINLRSWIGIILICVGAYILQLSKKEKGLFYSKTNFVYPIKTLLTHKGVMLSLVAYFIWAITPIFQKTAILHTTPTVPPFVSLTGMAGTNIIFGLMVMKSYPTNIFKITKKFLPLLILVGVLGGVGQAAAFMAFSQGSLGFVTAIFKLSMIFTVIFGWFFFKEKNIQDRLLGSLVMLGGVIFLAT